MKSNGNQYGSCLPAVPSIMKKKSIISQGHDLIQFVLDQKKMYQSDHAGCEILPLLDQKQALYI